MKTGIRAITTILCILGLVACINKPADNANNTEQNVPPSAAINDSTGLAASTQLLRSAEQVVVATPDALDSAVATAREHQAPLLVNDGSNSEAIEAELDRLGAKELQPETEQAPAYDNTTLLADYQPSATNQVALVTSDTDAPSLLTAMAAGIPVELLPVADPRASKTVVAEEAEGIYALGSGFKNFDQLLTLAAAGPVPGGETGLVFPGRRMIALYGHPSGPALGAMGEQDPTASVERVTGLVTEYNQLNDDPANPFVPAFEVIATVASSSPGDDGDFSNETSIEELRPYVEAIGKAGGYAVLDLQPGRANFLDQAKHYQELLELPYVGLALDPEWKIGPEEEPLSRVGSVTAAEINEVSTWLAQLCREKNLPQKVFVLHQFQAQMITDRNTVDVSHPELAYVLHADGHGEPGQKFDTWNMLREGLQPEFFLAWKNFYDEDTPMFSPERTLAVQPRPWFISYQ